MVIVKDALLEKRWGMEVAQVADWEALLSHQASAAPWGGPAPCWAGMRMGTHIPRRGVQPGAGARAAPGHPVGELIWCPCSTMPLVAELLGCPCPQ